MVQQTASILYLPSELLQDIFVSCVLAEQNNEGYNTPNPTTAPLVLSYICSSWRRLALETPQLWSRLHIEWTINKRWCPSFLGAIWFSRCASIPIRLSIYEHEDGYRGYANTGTYFALRYAAQLSSLSLSHSRHFASIMKQAQLDDLKFPLLTHLELKGWSVMGLGYLVNSARCPRLSRYRVDKLCPLKQFRQSFKEIKSLSSSIMHLDIHRIPINEVELKTISTMFPLLSNLSVAVEFQVGFGSEAGSQQKIIFPNLRRLKLVMADSQLLPAVIVQDEAPTLIFNRLFTPNLIALQIEFDGLSIQHYLDNYDITTSLNALIQPSQYTLQELSILRNRLLLNGSKILELALSIPTLRKFAFDDILNCTLGAIGEHFLVRVKDGQWEFFPLLEDLYCHVNAKELHRHSEDSFQNGYNLEDNIVPEGLKAIDQRMTSPFNRLERCQIKVITRGECGFNKVVSDTLGSLTELGLTYSVNYLGLHRVALRPLPMCFFH